MRARFEPTPRLSAVPDESGPATSPSPHVIGPDGLAAPHVIGPDGLAAPHAVDLDGLAAPRTISETDRRRFESYLGEILTALGMDLSTPGTTETPRRFLKALHDATSGYEGDSNLIAMFPAESPNDPGHRLDQIVEGPISFHALCEHHALPFYGVAHVGYIAGDRIIGISKLTRVVHLFARRFTVQERLGEQIVDTLDELLRPGGVAVRLEAQHLCTQMRGVREDRSVTVTTFWKGAYRTDGTLRRDFLQEIRGTGDRI